MERLGLALLLALGFHVVLLLLILPGQNEYEPVPRGKDQVAVSIDRQAAFPVEQIPEAVPGPEVEPEPEIMHEPEERTVKSIDIEPEKEIKTAQKISPRVKPVARKKDAPEKVSKPENTEPDERPQQRGKKAAFVQPVQIPVEASGMQVEAKETIGQAVPLEEKNIPPEYPGLARRRGWEGTVILEVDVKSNGQVGSVRIQTGSSYSLLDNAALDAVKRWQFAPGTKNGIPVAMTVHVPVHFVLKEQ